MARYFVCAVYRDHSHDDLHGRKVSRANSDTLAGVLGVEERTDTGATFQSPGAV